MRTLLLHAIACCAAILPVTQAHAVEPAAKKYGDFKPGDTILLHAAAGGVGLIVSQWAKLLGLNVIGTVSSEAKAEVARAHGCAHTINYSHEDVAKRVRELTDGVGVNVVFDSVGKDTFLGSLDSLKRRGLLVGRQLRRAGDASAAAPAPLDPTATAAAPARPDPTAPEAAPGPS